MYDAKEGRPGVAGALGLPKNGQKGPGLKEEHEGAAPASYGIKCL